METIASLSIGLVLLLSSTGVAVLLCLMVVDWLLEPNLQAAFGRHAADLSVAAATPIRNQPVGVDFERRYAGAHRPIQAGASLQTLRLEA